MVRVVAGEKRSLPSIDFATEAEHCPGCGGGLHVYKSNRRQVVTLAHGPIKAREIQKQCAENGCPAVRSSALTKLVKAGQKYGYDLIIQVGLLRYLSGLQREEIRDALQNEHSIELSAGSVSALCDRFLIYIEALHVARSPFLRQALGEYPLHLDATCERGKGGLFVCIDGWKGWVLWASRVASESADNLAPVIEKTVHMFGRPVATVRDMGTGVASSVESLRKAGIPDLICHYHFLAAVGRSLFKSLYDKLREMIRQSGCRAEMRTLLRDLVKRLENVPRFSATVKQLDARWTAFCELRDVLRLSKAELPRGDIRTMQTQLPALEMLRLEQIKQAVEQYTSDIEKRFAAKKKAAKRSKTAAGIILGYLQQYYPFLFGHPLKQDEQGCVVAVVERTNNVAEHFFGKEKQQLRRRVGRGQLGRDLDDQPAQVSLVANLRDPEYVHHLVGSIEKLPEAFADLDNAILAERLTLNRENRNSSLRRILREMLKTSVPCNEKQQSPSAVILPMPQQVKDPSVAEQEIAELLNPELRAQKMMALPKPRDPRLPPSGTKLVRLYKGRAHRIEILENSFKWQGKTYFLLSDIVQAIVKSQRNCYVFFGLTVPWPQNEVKIRGRRLNQNTMVELPVTTEF